MVSIGIDKLAAMTQQGWVAGEGWEPQPDLRNAMLRWEQAAFEDSGTYIRTPVELACGLTQTRRHRL